MGYFMRPAGGGAANDLTFPDDTVTLATTAAKLDFVLTNAGTTAGSVELGFSPSYLQGVDFDHGTAASPSYVVDPDNTPRTIQLERATGTGSSTVTLTGSSGAIGSFDCTVTAMDGLAEFVRVIATPTYEFKMDAVDGGGDLVQTGSVSGFNATLTGTSATATTTYTGLTGYVDLSDASNFFNSTSVPANTVQRDTDRTWIFVWRSYGAVTGSTYLATGGLGKGGSSWGYIKDSANDCYAISDLGGALETTTDLDDDLSHTGGGKSERLRLDSGLTSILAVSYDHSELVTTCRWKQTNHNTGFSYMSGGCSAQTDTGDYNMYWIGSPSSCLFPIYMQYFGQINQTITDANFSYILDSIGLG